MQILCRHWGNISSCFWNVGSRDSDSSDDPFRHVGHPLLPRLGGTLLTRPERRWTRPRRQTSLLRSRRLSMSANDVRHFCDQSTTIEQTGKQRAVTFLRVLRYADWMKDTLRHFLNHISDLLIWSLIYNLRSFLFFWCPDLKYFLN